MVDYNRSSGYVTFHEEIYAFHWHIPSATVYDSKHRVVATDCHNLNEARIAARGYLSESKREN